MAILTALLMRIAPVRVILKYDKSMNNVQVIRQGMGGSDISLRPLCAHNDGATRRLRAAS
jgi:hypothetical protein